MVPNIGDPIADSLETLAQTIVSPRVVSNPDTAQSILQLAENEGKPATSDAPALFLIGVGTDRVLWTADGSRGASGKFALSPVNQTEFKEDTASIGQAYDVSPTQSHRVLRSSLAMKPYPRAVMAIGQLWGNVTGVVNLSLRIGENDTVFSQFQARDNSTQTVTNIGVIPANVTPDIAIWVTGGQPGEPTGHIYLGQSFQWNSLAVLAQPITID